MRFAVQCANIRGGRREINNLLLPLAGGFEADIGKEHRHAGKFVAGPVLRPHAHERQRHGLRDAGGGFILRCAIKIHRRILKVAAAGGKQIPRKLVVRHIAAQRIMHPAVVGLRGVGPEVHGKLGLDAEQVAPFHGPVIGEFIALEQPVDEQLALVGIAILEKIPRLERRRERADHIQIHAPDKYGIGADFGRGEILLGQPGEDQSVNFAGGHRSNTGFIRRSLRVRGEAQHHQQPGQHRQKPRPASTGGQQ